MKIKETAKKIVKRYINDPIAFAREVLNFEPDEIQLQILEAYRDHRRVAIRSGHGIGKTACVAVCVLHFLFTHPNSKVITTAPTWRQVSEIMWTEIYKWAKKSFLINEADFLSTKIIINRDWFATGESCSEPQNMEGFHADHIMYVIDEAKGVPDEIFEAIEGALTTNPKIFVISTPGPPRGYFYKIFTDKVKIKQWKKIHISSIDSPRVSKEWIEEKKQEWGEDSPIYKARVLGEFPTTSEDMVFKFEWITDSYEKYEKMKEKHKKEKPEKKILSLDVATRGKDKAVFTEIYCYADGVKILNSIKVLEKSDTMELAGIIKSLDIENNYDNIVIDYTGNGEGVVDRLKEQGMNKVIGWISGSSPEETSLFKHEDRMLFLNKKAQGYWILRSFFRDGKIFIPNNDKLISELTQMGYEYQSSGKRRVLDPSEMELLKKRRYPIHEHVKSPDFADSLMMGVAVTEMFLKERWGLLPKDLEDELNKYVF